MGKGLLLIVLGGIMAGTSLNFQSRVTAIETTKKQSQYQEEVLAREIARSAYGVAHRKAQAAGNDLDRAIGNVNGTLTNGRPDLRGEMVGGYQGGTYGVQAYSLDGQNVRIRSIGYFGQADFTINENYNIKLLTVKDFSKIKIDFLQSMAGYCSAVFLQRYLPNLNGVPPAALGGFANQIVRDNAINNMALSDDEQYWVLPPEMLFDSGHNRTGANTTASPDNIILAPGTRMNFSIGVDQNCSSQGQWEDIYDINRYDWVHNALDEDTQNLADLQEGKYSMIEQHKTDDQKWRIAFEDLNNFSDAQLEDIKANGYGGSWDSVNQTYGGAGWTQEDALGYHKLKDFGGKPDFSDQVIEVTLTPCNGSCVPAS